MPLHRAIASLGARVLVGRDPTTGTTIGHWAEPKEALRQRVLAMTNIPLDILLDLSDGWRLQTLRPAWMCSKSWISSGQYPMG